MLLMSNETSLLTFHERKLGLHASSQFIFGAILNPPYRLYLFVSICLHVLLRLLTFCLIICLHFFLFDDLLTYQDILSLSFSET